jgi:hypothetical protein
MRLPTAAGLTGLALLSLAACNKAAPAGNAVASGASAPAAAAPAASGPLSADQIPHRKPGLWKQVVSLEGSPNGMTTELCVDAASEAKASAFSQSMTAEAHCTTPQFSRGLDGSISFAGACDMGPNGKSSTKGVIKGDFNSSYTADIDTQYSGAAMAGMSGEHKMIMTATWTGPCAPDQKGGDIILPGGMKRNILESGAGGPPAGGPPSGGQ